MTAEFESNIQERVSRRRLLPTVVMNGSSDQVAGWSLVGFDLFLPSDSPYQIGERVDLDFVLPFASFDISLHVAAKLVSGGANESSFEFVDLPETARRSMREFAEASIEGKVTSVEGLIKPVAPDVTPTVTEKELTPTDSKQLDRRFIRNALRICDSAFPCAGADYMVVGVSQNHRPE